MHDLANRWTAGEENHVPLLRQQGRGLGDSPLYDRDDARIEILGYQARHSAGTVSRNL
ncbi:hypothetical protein D3C72_2515370 [compost metagenome]